MNKNIQRVAWVFGLWLLFILLSKHVYLFVSAKVPIFSPYDAQAVLWAWGSFVLGILLSIKLSKWSELLIGSAIFICCLLPFAGIFIGLAYYIRCFNLLIK